MQLHNGDRASSRSSVESSCNACRVATDGRTEVSKEKLLALGFLKLSSRSMQLFLKNFKVVLRVLSSGKGKAYVITAPCASLCISSEMCTAHHLNFRKKEVVFAMYITNDHPITEL